METKQRLKIQTKKEFKLIKDNKFKKTFLKYLFLKYLIEDIIKKSKKNKPIKIIIKELKRGD